MKKSLILFVLFGLVATLCDLVWVRLGVLVYSDPAPWGQAWWTPLLFGFVGVAAVHTAAVVTKLLTKEIPTAPEASNVNVMLSGVLFVSAYLSGGLFNDAPGQMTAILTVSWVLRLAIIGFSEGKIAGVTGVCIAMSVAGTLGEAALVAIGLMRYPVSDLLGLPIWLPALWLHAGALARDVARVWFYGR